MLGDEGFEDGEDFFLLTARELARGVEELPEPAARSEDAARTLFAQELFDAHAQGVGHRQEDVRARGRASALPKADVGRLFADLAGEFAQGNAASLPEGAQAGSFLHFGHEERIAVRVRKGLHVRIILRITAQ